MAINLAVQENRSSEDHDVTRTHFQEKQPTDGNKNPVQIYQFHKNCKQNKNKKVK